MKHALPRSVLILFVLLCSFGEASSQDSLSSISGTWNRVATQLLRRNDVAANLLSAFEGVAVPDSTLLPQARAALTGLTLYIQKALPPDSLVIAETYKKNKAATGQLVRLLVMMETEKAKVKDEARHLMAILEVTESRLASEISLHNTRMQELRRNDLLFVER